MGVFRTGLLLALAMLFVAAGTSWGQDGPESLFSPAPDGAHITASEDGQRRRFVVVDTSLLQKPASADAALGIVIRLELFGGESYVVDADSIESMDGGGAVWQGHIQGQADGTVTLATRDNATAGTIRASGRLYRLTYAGDGVHLLEEMPLVEPMTEALPIPVDDSQPETDSGPDGDESGQAVSADSGSVVDILVVYTPASRARYGGSAGIEALIDLAVAETNTAYANSLINTRLSLVEAAEVSYGESGSMYQDLYRLRNKSDGYLDQVHGLRDTYAADTVVLIEESTDYCGIAFLMTSLSYYFEDDAFSVVHSSCATGYYSFGHELGHNMGSTHDHANASGSLYPYSFGYWAPGYSFRTIMAYSCPGGCTRIQHFSNPSVQYNGQWTGVAYNGSNSSVAADNARSINAASYTVANWRNSATREPAAPTSLTAVAQSPNRISLSWQDNSSAELGFDVERRIAGQSWSSITDLPANATSFQDYGLAADTTYEYRVRSYTANRYSSYSNVAGDTTPRYPEVHIGEFGGGGSYESGITSGSLVWRATVVVSVHDAYHGPVNGATVSGQWSGGASGSANCVTDGSGYCTIQKTGLDAGTASVSFTLVGITYGSDPYLPDHNHDLSGNTITMAKPVAAIVFPLIQKGP